MGKILCAYVMPHPPILLKEIGKGEEKKAQKTMDAMMAVGREIKAKKPGVIVLITPHGPLFRDAVTISVRPELKGDMSRFGAKSVKFLKDNDLHLVDKIVRYAGKKNIACALMDQDMAREYGVSSELDHGTMVPLYFIDQEYVHYKLIHITYGLLPREDLYHFGKAIQEAIDEIEDHVVVIASGDLSHRLTVDAPAGYTPKGKEFDQLLMELLERGRVEEILALDHCLAEEAGECGLRAIDIMLGTIDGYEQYPQILSYEGPFGVGYGVVKIDIGARNRDKQFVEKLYKNRIDKIHKIRLQEDAYVQLARKALETYVREGITMDAPENIHQELIKNKAGVFVSIKKYGELRGCIGTIYPTMDNIAVEIIHNAIGAGTKDPRFYPVEEEELDELTYSVDILKEPEEVNGLDQLDPKKYGVIVTSGRKTGLLLPNLENVNTVEEQVKIALQKAGICPNEGYNLQRFEVIRHK